MTCDISTGDLINATMVLFAMFVVGYLIGYWMRGK